MANNLGTAKANRPDAEAVLRSHRLTDDLPLYAIGSFDTGVTVISQQTRALNLAWSMVETETIPVRGDDRRLKVAVVGTGFAGLTFAAGLLKKASNCDLFLFEQRDSLLPLQQGSDTRWLHPHIYDWPADGSEASAAMLPVLNWTAARSSDVVVQVLSEWEEIVESGGESLKLFCNVRHLQIADCNDNNGTARLEWVGERRAPRDGTTLDDDGLAGGSSETFDVVILAVGFGLESARESYWRNETLGQPSLNEPRRTYLLSGQGDGAMIDLLRIRVSQFRQDRILDELFADKPKLVAELKTFRADFVRDATGLFGKFETLVAEGSEHNGDMNEVLGRLRRRLRRDTDVVLRLLVRNISDLLEPNTSRISFQNALLVFLLYRCGGFAPTTEGAAIVRQRFAIDKGNVIERHGVRPLEQLKRIIPAESFEYIERRRSLDPATYGMQSALSAWSGGYFGYPGRVADTGKIEDGERRQWRKEYLPGPTALVASTLCGSVAGAIERLLPNSTHFRITLHRTVSIHREELLQQACDYIGKGLEGATATAGRTFPATAATIGAAYRCRSIVRTPKDVKEEGFVEAMTQLDLHQASRKMLPGVNFAMAIPLLQPEDSFYAPSPVIGVVYIDSRDDDFWLENEDVENLRLVIETAVRALAAAQGTSFGRIRNFALEPIRDVAEPASDSAGTSALEIVRNVRPPSTEDVFVLNFDHTDLAPVTTKSTTPDPQSNENTNA